MNDFSPQELARYARHFNLPELGLAGQQRLKAAKVLCVGAGGLGSPLLLYLAAAGVGTIGIIDDDKVELTNLQRQVLYDSQQLGLAKASAAKQKLLALNPHLTINIYQQRLSEDNALGIIQDYDIVADGSDNFATRYLVNDACFHLQIPDVYAGILQFEGQCSIFASKDGPCYRCLYDSPPPPGLVPSCAEGGVLGVLPGILGSIQATEVIKLICKIGEPLVARLLCVDALTMQFKRFNLQRDPDCRLCTHRQAFATLPRPTQSCVKEPSMNIPEITATELQQLLTQQTHLQLVDVREQHEYAICHINGMLIPLGQLPSRISELDPTLATVVYCRSGHRSMSATQFLLDAGFSDVKNLQGGILAWIDDVDNSLQKY